MNRLTVFPKLLKTWFATHWRSLLLLLVGVYVPLQIFAILSLRIWKLEGGLIWEIPLMVTIHNAATESIDRVALFITELGSVNQIAPFAMTIALGLFLKKRWRSLIFLLITLVGSETLNLAAKSFWHRIRPILWEGYPRPQDFSFPSGHAMMSMSLAATLIILVWGSRWVWLLLPLSAVYVVAIGWTRLYLGVHYPSDVLAGWMLAIAWVIGMAVLVKPYKLFNAS